MVLLLVTVDERAGFVLLELALVLPGPGVQVPQGPIYHAKSPSSSSMQTWQSSFWHPGLSFGLRSSPLTVFPPRLAILNQSIEIISLSLSLQPHGSSWLVIIL